MIKLLIQG